MAADGNLRIPRELKPILNKQSIVVYFAAGAAVAGSAWTTFVPQSVSGSTFGSILAVAFGSLVVSTIVLHSRRPAASVAQVLYETEHRSGVSAQRGLRGRDSADAS